MPKNQTTPELTRLAVKLIWKTPEIQCNTHVCRQVHIKKCSGQESNLHSFRNRNLNPARLPVPPPERMLAGILTCSYIFALRKYGYGFMGVRPEIVAFKSSPLGMGP